MVVCYTKNPEKIEAFLKDYLAAMEQNIKENDFLGAVMPKSLKLKISISVIHRTIADAFYRSNIDERLKPHGLGGFSREELGNMRNLLKWTGNSVDSETVISLIESGNLGLCTDKEDTEYVWYTKGDFEFLLDIETGSRLVIENKQELSYIPLPKADGLMWLIL